MERAADWRGSVPHAPPHASHHHFPPLATIFHGRQVHFPGSRRPRERPDRGLSPRARGSSAGARGQPPRQGREEGEVRLSVTVLIPEERSSMAAGQAPRGAREPSPLLWEEPGVFNDKKPPPPTHVKKAQRSRGSQGFLRVKWVCASVSPFPHWLYEIISSRSPWNARRLSEATAMSRAQDGKGWATGAQPGSRPGLPPAPAVALVSGHRTSEPPRLPSSTLVFQVKGVWQELKVK